MYLDHSTTCKGKKEINNYLRHCIYCKVIKQRITVHQQKALHSTGIYLNQGTIKQVKLGIDSLKQCIYSNLINQCLTVRITQQKAFHDI